MELEERKVNQLRYFHLPRVEFLFQSHRWYCASFITTVVGFSLSSNLCFRSLENQQKSPLNKKHSLSS